MKHKLSATHTAKFHVGITPAGVVCYLSGAFPGSTSDTDAKLLPNLGGFGSVNRLAIVAVQEDCNQILTIAKTENGTGEVEARAVAGALEEWELTNKVIASGFYRLDHSFHDVAGRLEDVSKTSILPDGHDIILHGNSC